MRFLYINEAAEWCREHGMEIGDGSFRLQPDSRLAHTSRLLYAPHGPTDQAPAITEACMSVMGPWGECLLWVTDWDIWPSTEDWPTAYAARGARGERLSLAEKPGHLFVPGQEQDLRLFLSMVIQYSWDAHVLPVLGVEANRRLKCSHDGWIDVYATTPVEIVVAAC
jgi:hypothetical protein